MRAGLVTADLLRLLRRPANLVLLAVQVLVLILLFYLVTWLVLRNPPPGANFGGQSPEDLKKVLYLGDFAVGVVQQYLPGLGSAFAITTGVLVFGSDFGWGTYKTLFIQGPSRLAVIAARVVAIALFLLLTIGLLLLSAIAITSLFQVVDGATGTPTHWPGNPEVLEAAGIGWLVMLMWAMIGAALVTLFRNVAVSIVIGLVYVLLVEGLLLSLLSTVSWIREVRRWLPVQASSNLARLIKGTYTVRPSPTAASVAASDPGQAAAVVVGLLLLSLAVVAVVFIRRDVE